MCTMLGKDPTNTTAIGITRLQKEFMVKLTFTVTGGHWLCSRPTGIRA